MKTLDLREKAPAERHPFIFNTFADLQQGEEFILINDHDPKPLYYQFDAEKSGQFTWNILKKVLITGR